MIFIENWYYSNDNYVYDYSMCIAYYSMGDNNTQ